MHEISEADAFRSGERRAPPRGAGAPPTARTHEAWRSDGTLTERFAADAGPGRRVDGAQPVEARAATRPGAFVARMTGPGGYYNVGNALALTVGLGVQLAAVERTGGAGAAAALDAARAYFVGSPGATALTVAMAIFFASGEAYHRAWSRGAPPDIRLNRWGDLLSGFGALVLTVALAGYGETTLAIASGVLLAGGKFGTAVVPERPGAPDRSNRLPALFRTAVLLSRAPAIAALAVELWGWAAGAAAMAGGVVMTATMLVCYLLWARADLLLAYPRPRSPATPAA